MYWHLNNLFKNSIYLHQTFKSLENQARDYLLKTKNIPLYCIQQSILNYWWLSEEDFLFN